MGLGDGGGLFVGALPFYSRTLTSSIPAKAGISLFAEAGRATLAPLCFVICAEGAGIGRFPLSREWGGFFGLGAWGWRRTLHWRTSILFPHSHLFHSRESGNLPVCWGGAGNARAALVCNLRRWRWNREIPAFAGMGRIFLFHAYFLSAALTSSIPAKAGISLLAEAGRATLAPLRFVICAGGAGIGRFPLSREWKGFFYSTLIFYPPHSPLPFPRKRESPCLLRRGEQRSRRFGL